MYKNLPSQIGDKVCKDFSQAYIFIILMQL